MNQNYIKIALSFIRDMLFIAIVAKAISLSISFFIPSIGVYRNWSDIKSSIAYHRYDFWDAFVAPTKKRSNNNKNLQHINTPLFSIDNLMLKAVYKDKNGGYIVIEDKKDRKSKLLSMGEIYKGYKLIGIYPKKAIFTSKGKRYQVTFGKNDILILKSLNKQLPITKNIQVAVKQKDVLYYRKHFKEIWKDISINEYKKNGKIKGFRVDYININSIFGKLGLRAGDIIIKVNDEPLTNFNYAFELYKNIEDYDQIKLTILRNHKIKDIIYEVN